MVITEATTFLVVCIFLCLSALVIAMTVLAVNQLFTHFWRPVVWFKISEFDELHRADVATLRNEAAAQKHQ
jgi:hypothetical protein